MKYTFNLDAELLERVVETTGAKTKTEAITFALREVDRRARLASLLREGSGLTEAGLRDMFDPVSECGGLEVAETPANYGKAPRRKRT